MGRGDFRQAGKGFIQKPTLLRPKAAPAEAKPVLPLDHEGEHTAHASVALGLTLGRHPLAFLREAGSGWAEAALGRADEIRRPQDDRRPPQAKLPASRDFR